MWNFPIEEFDFIGITEFYDDDFSYFTSKFTPEYELNVIPDSNKNPDAKGLYADQLDSNF